MTENPHELERILRRQADYNLPDTIDDDDWESDELSGVTLVLSGSELRDIIRLLRQRSGAVMAEKAERAYLVGDLGFVRVCTDAEPTRIMVDAGHQLVYGGHHGLSFAVDDVPALIHALSRAYCELTRGLDEDTQEKP